MPLSPESRICWSLLDWWRIRYPGYDQHLIRVDNGGKRSKEQRHFDYKMGEVPGASDYFLALPSGKYHGLWLEIKTETGKPSENQIDFLKSMRAKGYFGVFAYGLNEAGDILDAWMHDTIAEFEWLQHFDKKGERNRERKKRLSESSAG